MSPNDAPSMLQTWVIDGGFMMVFLVPTAVLLVAYTVQGHLNLRTSRVAPASLRRELLAALAAGGYAGARALLAKSRSSIGVVLHNTLAHLDIRPGADPSEALHEEIANECELLEQQNSQLSVIYTIAPLMGLLGTVFGMLDTFRKFAVQESPEVADLAVGIYVALVTTAWGLSIAIPAYLVLFLLRRRIMRYEAEILPVMGNEALRALLAAPDAPRAQGLRQEP